MQQKMAPFGAPFHSPRGPDVVEYPVFQSFYRSGMRWALALNHIPFFSCWWALANSQTNSHLASSLQKSGKHTDGFLIASLKYLHISENITHKKVQDPGNQSAFYFTVHSCKFLHFQGNQITFRLALLVTKSYNYPGFKNKIGWYTWTILSF